VGDGVKLHGPLVDGSTKALYGCIQVPPRIQRESASDAVYKLLRTDIIQGRYSPLQRLYEPEVARRFEVSRTPLREALKKLESEGFVERIPAGGLIVAPIDEDDVASLYLIRSLLEGLVARQAAEKATPPDILQLRSLISQMDLLNATHPEEATAVGHRFHSKLAEIADNRRCDEIVANVRRQLERYWMLTVVHDAPRRSVAVDEHRNIIEAVAAHDPDRAESAMRVHIVAGSANVVEGVRRHLDQVRPRQVSSA
jgi:DNA-binding GntR family transcriptional regulator